MAVFNDVEPEDKLLLYPHRIEWKDHLPVPDKKEAETVSNDKKDHSGRNVYILSLA